MKRVYSYLLMAFGIGLISGCQNEEELAGWLKDPDRLNAQEARELEQWLQVNELDAQAFVARDSSQSHSGTYSVLVEGGAVHAIKANGVKSLAHLSELPQLTDLNLGKVKLNTLTDCPPPLKKLRLMGKELRSLQGIESCSQLESVKIVHSNISDLEPLFKLPQLRQLTFNFSALSEVVINYSAPQLESLNLQKNQLQQLAIEAEQPQLKQLFLDQNQLKTVELNGQTPQLVTLSLANNQIEDLSQMPPIKSLTGITLSNNPVKDLKPLENWSGLQRIKYKGGTDTPGHLGDKVDPQLTAADKQWQEATYLKEKYLADGKFIEELPKFSGGKVAKLSKQTSSLFSLIGSSSVSGWIKAGKISGMVKVPVVKTDNLSYQYKTINIEGTATVAQGELSIFGPEKVNFWQMAALFVDQPIKKQPEEISDLIFEGYRVNVIKAGETKRFKAQLMPFSDRYLLLVAATDPSGEAVGVELQFE